jgi:hypothetical protein
MSYRPQRFLFSIVTVLTFSFNLAAPITVYADDAPSPAEGSGDETAPPQDSNPEPESPAEAPADNPPAAEPAPASDPEPEQAAETPPAAEPESVAEVLAQIPDDTDLVVLDEQGEAQPLASQAAADTIVNGDPMWCPGTTLPGGAGCTPAFDAFNLNVNDGGLLAELASGSYTGPGTIYVAQGYNSSLEGGNVLINGSSPGLNGLGNLTIQGGWDFGLNTLAGTSTFTGISLSIDNWFNGSVTLNDIIINNNNVLSPNSGLFVESGGNIILNNVDARSVNSYGADLVNDDAVSGTVLVTNSDFSDSLITPSSGDDGGLRILSSGDVTLTNVSSNDHQNYGALIETLGSVTVNGGTFNNQGNTGLYVESGGAISLNNVTASDSGTSGAYLDNGMGTGVTVTNSTFNNNNGSYGLFADSSGSITLDTVTASGNSGYGAQLSTSGTGDINVDDSTFNNNSVKGLYAESSGDITLNTVTASNNGSYGALLEADYGTGNIFVNDSTFIANGEYGLAAMTGDGDINLSNVTVDGEDPVTFDILTYIGAWLGSYGGGSVNITNSTFENMSGYGLKIGTSGPVNLTNVTASNNGADGAYIYNKKACYSPFGIPVTVDGGTYQNNGGYGLYLSPGPAGTLTFLAAPTFSGNGAGDYLLNLVVDCTPPPPKEETPKPPKKPVNIVELPPTDGNPVDQDCEEFSGTELVLPNGTTAEIGCPFEGDSLIEEVNEAGLPAELPLGPEFVSGVSLEFNATEDEDGKTEDALVTLSFDIPEGMGGESFTILFWDPTANDGQGDWVELPLAQIGVSEFPLNPDDPDDTRKSSGVQVVDGKVTVTVNFPGVFVLVAR